MAESTVVSVDAASDPLSPVRTPAPKGFALRVFLLGVFLMPLQLNVDAARGVVESRLPPGDLFLVLSILLAPNIVRFRRSPVLLLPLALMGVLAYGTALAIVYATYRDALSAGLGSPRVTKGMNAPDRSPARRSNMAA